MTDTKALLALAGQDVGRRACRQCGTMHLADASETAGSWKQIRLDENLCDICAIGEERARIYADGRGPKWLIVNGKYYATSEAVPLGSPDPRPNAPSWDKGFGGARWDFQRLDGSEPQTTYSLWHGGTVTEWMRERMPDNARFLSRDEVSALSPIKEKHNGR